MSVTLPTPLKVHATDDDTNKYLYVIGTIAAWGGIDIDVNAVATRFPNFVDDVMALADEIYTEYASTYGWTNDTESGHSGSGNHRDGSDGVIQSANDIQGYLDYLVSGLKPFNPVASLVDYRFAFCLIRAIARWADTNIHSYSLPDGAVGGDVYVQNNTIDVYTYKSLRFDFPALPSDGFSTVVFPVNNCTFTFYINPPQYLYSSLAGGSSTSTNLRIGYYACVIAPNNSDVYLLTFRAIDNFDFNGCSVYNLPLSSFYASDGYRYGFMFDRGDAGRVTFLALSDDSSYFIFNGTRSYLRRIQSGSSDVAFKDDSGNFMRDMTFSDGLLALVWFFDLCGINVRQNSSSVYVEVDTSPSPIVIDNTTYDNTVTNITNVVTNNTYQEGDSVEMVFPSYYVTNNYYNYDDYRQHPEYILDFNQDGLLNTDFNMPSYDGNILATKFPFCIPFDCYNLVANLVAEPEAPQFHWLVLPANSFGMSNEDFYIDLDFTPYNFLVQLMRFFIAAGFVVWLMTKTKDLMQ